MLKLFILALLSLSFSGCARELDVIKEQTFSLSSFFIDVDGTLGMTIVLFIFLFSLVIIFLSKKIKTKMGMITGAMIVSLFGTVFSVLLTGLDFSL